MLVQKNNGEKFCLYFRLTGEPFIVNAMVDLTPAFQ
jgi:hypothetical protein